MTLDSQQQDRKINTGSVPLLTFDSVCLFHLSLNGGCVVIPHCGGVFLKDFFFLMWVILKVFIEFAPGPGIKPEPPALEGKVLTTGPPGKSPHCSFNLHFSDN